MVRSGRDVFRSMAGRRQRFVAVPGRVSSDRSTAPIAAVTRVEAALQQPRESPAC